MSMLVSLELLIEVTEITVGSRITNFNIVAIGLLESNQSFSGLNLGSKKSNEFIVRILKS
jgi:hypothetical protein